MSELQKSSAVNSLLECPEHPTVGDTSPRRFALATAIATFLLICIGSLVTSFGVGLAVPDWPTTFGENMFTYNWFNSGSVGVFIEHGHRLAGATVGLMTLVLAVWLWVSESRKWMRNLGVIALVAVCIQGVMGGLRVSQVSQAWALIHGAFAQAFFGLIVSLAVFSSNSWKKGSVSEANPRGLRRITLITTAMVYLQILAGSFVRHTGEGLMVHLFLALGVFVHLGLVAKRAFGEFSNHETVTRFSAILAGIGLLQLLLGLGAWATTYGGPEGVAVRGQSLQVLIGSLHVAVGALLFASCLALTCVSFSIRSREEARVS